MKGALKLYVWSGEGIQQDYYSGMICIMAHSKKEALALAKAEGGTVEEECRSKAPQVYRRPVVMVQPGGG